MDRNPLISFVLFAVIGSLLVATGAELLVQAGSSAAANSWLSFWLPSGLILAGVVLLFAAWRLLRFTTLATFIIMSGVALAWAAPSLRPLAGVLLGGAIRLVWDLASGDEWKTAIGQYLDAAAEALSTSVLAPSDHVFYGDLIFISGGLGLVLIGTWLVIRRMKGQSEHEQTVTITIEEEDLFGSRRKIVEMPAGKRPIKTVRKVLRSLDQPPKRSSFRLGRRRGGS